MGVLDSISGMQILILIICQQLSPLPCSSPGFFFLLKIMRLNEMMTKIFICIKVLVSCVQLCDPMDCSLPDSSFHGIFQARILEWVAIPFSRGSSWPRDQTQVSCIAGRFFTFSATMEALCFCNSAVQGEQLRNSSTGQEGGSRSRAYRHSACLRAARWGWGRLILVTVQGPQSKWNPKKGHSS